VLHVPSTAAILTTLLTPDLHSVLCATDRQVREQSGDAHSSPSNSPVTYPETPHRPWRWLCPDPVLPNTHTGMSRYGTTALTCAICHSTQGQCRQLCPLLHRGLGIWDIVQNLGHPNFLARTMSSSFYFWWQHGLGESYPQQIPIDRSDVAHS
jgi:hypothetical protein